MVHIHDLFDPALLDRMLTEKFVRARADEQLPVTVYDYAEKAQYQREWNPVTLTCRGLLVHTHTGQVLARGLPKFFNHTEPEAAPIGSGPVEVYDKADGSLGILFPVPDHPGEYRISTRGSLRSRQADVGTDIWQSRYAHRFTPNPSWTYLFEIIAPVTRVVVDYGATRDLILIGAQDTSTGAPVPFDDARAGWPGPVVERFGYATLAEALAADPRPNAEGYVVLDPATGNRVKIKQEDYKRLHGIVTGLRVLDLWELLAVEATRTLPVGAMVKRLRMDAGKITELRASLDNGMDALLARVPDELFGHIDAEMRRIRAEAAALHGDLVAGLDALGLDALPDRKAKALTIQQRAGDQFTMHAWLQLLNGVDITPMVWVQLRPDPHAMVLDSAPTAADTDDVTSEVA